MDSSKMDRWTHVMTIIIFLFLVAGLVAWIAELSGEFERECRDLGGHVTVSTGVNTNGGITNTTFCLSDDGRILKVG